MKTLHDSRSVALLTPYLLVAMGFGLFHSAETTAQKSEMRTFTSEQGGVELSIPTAWFVKEVPGDERYQEFFSREKVEKEGDLFLVGVSITRVKDYRRAFKFKTTRPADIATEYANRIAAGVGKGSRNLVISMPGSIAGMNAYTFRISAGGGSPECISMWLVVGIKGKEWVHALWEVPCTESEANSADVNAMIDSFKVDKEWGKKGT